MNRRLSANED